MRRADSPLLALLLSLATVTASAAPPVGSLENPYLDLHSHLFMKEGLGWMFKGDFDDVTLSAHKWDNGFSSQVNAATLEASHLGLVVVSLYASQPFVLDPRAAIRKQIAMAERFVASHPDWVIAKGAGEARAALANGKRVLVLSLEGAANILETDRDIHEFIDEKGIRIVTFSHLTDDEFGGAALLASYHVLADPVGWLKAVLARGNSCENVQTKNQGLTARGEKLARALAAHKVWLDLTHASDETVQGLLPILHENNQPVLFTHTTLRKFYGAERGLADWELEEVRATRGLIGVMPGHEMLAGTPVPVLQDELRNSPDCSTDDVRRLSVQYNEFAAVLGNDSVSIGSDFNGAVPHLKPGKCKTGTSLDRKGGFYKVSQTGQLWKAMKATGARVTDDPREPLNRFLDAWKQISP